MHMQFEITPYFCIVDNRRIIYPKTAHISEPVNTPRRIGASNALCSKCERADKQTHGKPNSGQD